MLRVGGHDDPFLVLTEVQLRVDPHMPRRIQAYAALAEAKYHLLVYPIVFYLLPPDQEQVLPDHYHSKGKALKKDGRKGVRLALKKDVRLP